MTEQATREQYEAAVRALNIEDLTARYIQLRDIKKQKTDAHKTEMAVIDGGMERIEHLMHAWLKFNKVDSVATQSGTPYLTEKTGATISNREAFVAFVAENFAERNAFFTNAIAKDVVKSYMEDHEGAAPPGVDWYSAEAVNVRRS